VNFDALEEKSEINKVKSLPINYTLNTSNKGTSSYNNLTQP
jgi:hypothetical protein